MEDDTRRLTVQDKSLYEIIGSFNSEVLGPSGEFIVH